MKKVTTIIILLLALVNCKAQTPVLDLSDQGWNHIGGAYYKDTQNLLNPFVGTYVFTIGNTSFKVVLQKKIMASVNNVFYEDIIVGEYQYIQNGIEKLNTLSNLNIPHTDGSDYNINGNFVLTGKELGCDDCSINEKRLRLSLSDDTTDRIAKLDIRKVTINGQQAIKVKLWWLLNGLGRTEGSPLPATPIIPSNTYIMIKQ